ncbi:MAG: hypothetical protein ABIR62_16945 [Dokdonella sp.]|uniref:hypothetical protein n=1 Tax=Dokdonella sp. TaxID=2291710 RepID=UPI00326589A4
MGEFPDEGERVWIQLENDDELRQAVFDLPTKTFTCDGEEPLHANQIVAWKPLA